MERNSLIAYTQGLLITLTTLLIWFYGPIKTTLGQWLFDKNIYSNDQFETALLLRNKKLAILSSCFICFSFWTSLTVGAILAFANSLSPYFPLITAFTYPSIAYLYKTFIDRKS
jgi:hypothetical protein